MKQAPCPDAASVELSGGFASTTKGLGRQAERKRGMQTAILCRKGGTKKAVAPAGNGEQKNAGFIPTFFFWIMCPYFAREWQQKGMNGETGYVGRVENKGA